MSLKLVLIASNLTQLIAPSKGFIAHFTNVRLFTLQGKTFIMLAQVDFKWKHFDDTTNSLCVSSCGL